MDSRLLAEAIGFGLLLIPLTYLTTPAARALSGGKPALPEVCARWNETRVMEIQLFLAGFALRLALAALGGRGGLA